MKKIVLFLFLLANVMLYSSTMYGFSLSDITQNSAYQIIKKETAPTQDISKKAYNEFSNAYADAKTTVKNTVLDGINSNSYLKKFVYYLKIGFNTIWSLIKTGFTFLFG